MPTLHHDAVVVDAHNDLPIMLTDWYRRLGRRGYFADTWIPRLRRGGVDVQVIPIYVEPRAAEASLRHTLLLLELMHEEIEENADEVALCRSGSALDAALAAGRIAIVLALEGCAAVGDDVALLRTFHRLGVRIASFTHLGRTGLADGSGEDATGGRLSAAGVAAVREMERLGMLLDVSHLSVRGVEHVLELATRPVIATHSSARALCDHHRNLSDDALRAVAATGGVVGVNVLPAFIDAEAPSLERVLDHIEHMVEVAGAEHVGLGPDFIAEYGRVVYPNEPWEIAGIDLKRGIAGLAGTEDLPTLTAAMLRRGLPEATIRKVLGENFVRVFRQGFGPG